MKIAPAITAVIATGLLLSAAPALADDRHGWRGNREASASTSHPVSHRGKFTHSERHRKEPHHHKRKQAYKKGYEKGYRDARRQYHFPRYRHGHHKPRWRPTRFRYGYHWRHLPHGFVRISLGPAGLYFYSDGIFFRRHRHRGYVVARPPVGAIVRTLPGTAVTVVLNGRNYYVAYDTYYLWDSAAQAYRVVANPGLL